MLGVVYEDFIIFGYCIVESLFFVFGMICVFDVVCGDFVWSFEMILVVDVFGGDIWLVDVCEFFGGVNSWVGMVFDEECGIVYVLIGLVVFDYWGGN